MKHTLLASAVAILGTGAVCAEPPASTSTAKSLQGGDEHQRTWADNPSMRAFYELTVATLRKGTDKIDFPAYQQKSYAIFREFGASMGWKPEAMIDHLKDVPRQMVGIVKDDPQVLDSYDRFKIALAGPP